jgi:hypothetical protein
MCSPQFSFSEKSVVACAPIVHRMETPKLQQPPWLAQNRNKYETVVAVDETKNVNNEMSTLKGTKQLRPFRSETNSETPYATPRPEANAVQAERSARHSEVPKKEALYMKRDSCERVPEAGSTHGPIVQAPLKRGQERATA